MGGFDLSHLAPEFRDKALLPNDERIEFVMTDRWIDYPVARRALAKLQFMIRSPKRVRATHLLIHAGPGMGKTMISMKIVKDNPPIDHGRDDTARIKSMRSVPVIRIEMPPHPTERFFYSAIQDAVS